MMSIRDGQDDQVNRCLCIHTFAFRPSKANIEEALQQAQIGRNRWYSFVPIWAYRGTPSQLEPQRGGTLSFLRDQSSVPCLKVLASTFQLLCHRGSYVHDMQFVCVFSNFMLAQAILSCGLILLALIWLKCTCTLSNLAHVNVALNAICATCPLHLQPLFIQHRV